MPTSHTPRQRGFTLIELMIGVSVIGILSSVALPAFESQLQKARRSDALVAAMQVQAAQERFRSQSTSYGSLVDIGAPATSAARHYALQVVANDADGFEFTATATGAQARDAGCRHMKLSSRHLTLVYASGADTSFGNDATATRRCWNL